MPVKILLADDDPALREFLATLLAPLASDLLTTGDGLEALELIEREAPDLLVTDLRMPILDGVALVEALRSSPSHRAFPILCLSAVSDEAEIRHLVQMGITDYILKPVDAAAFEERVRRAIAQIPPRAGADAPATSHRVLIVHPDDQARRALARHVAARATVLEAASAAQALRIAQAVRPRPTALLTRQRLPVIGEEKLRALVARLAEADPADFPAWLVIGETAEPVAPPPGYRGVLRYARDEAALAREVARVLDARTTGLQR